jgi:YbbR domain-containing protein
VFLDFSPVTAPGEYEVYVRIVPLVDNKFAITNPTMRRSVTVIQTYERNIQISADVSNVRPIEGMTIDESNVMVNPTRVKIWGEKTLVDSIHSVQVRVESPSSPISANVSFPGELMLFDIDGMLIDTTNLNIEERAFSVIIPVFKRKTIRLTADIINFPPNFNSSSLPYTVTPEDLIMASPDDSISQLESWSLGAVSLSDITLSDVRNGLNIDIVLPSGYKNISGENRARLDFDVSGYGEMAFQVPSRNFDIINLPTGFEVTYLTRQVSVRVVGPSEDIASITVDDIGGVINFAGMSDISLGERAINIKFSISGQDVRAWVIGDYRVEIRIVEKNED